ncbi:methionyl-tRNA formyltransferase [Aquimarina rhabdastrellae]
MKIILIGNFPLCQAIYNAIERSGNLHAVCFENNKAQDFFITHIKQQGYDTFAISKENISTSFKDWLVCQEVDLVIVCGLSIKVPEAVLAIPKHGFLNVHFGLLPQNAGPDPVFWSLKNGEQQTAITIHKMNTEWDKGPLLVQKTVPIIIGETYGILNSKLIHLSAEVWTEAFSKLHNNANYIEQNITHNTYNSTPKTIDLTINWETQTSEQIEYLVNAANPKYDGATTYYQGSEFRILEVSPVDSQTPLFGKTPGEIIHAHPHEGLYVCCKYGQLIRINVLKSDAGILSGAKYVNLGLQQGQRFTSVIKQETTSNIT